MVKLLMLLYNLFYAWFALNINLYFFDGVLSRLINASFSRFILYLGFLGFPPLWHKLAPAKGLLVPLTGIIIITTSLIYDTKKRLLFVLLRSSFASHADLKAIVKLRKYSDLGRVMRLLASLAELSTFSYIRRVKRKRMVVHLFSLLRHSLNFYVLIFGELEFDRQLFLAVFWNVILLLTLYWLFVDQWH